MNLKKLISILLVILTTVASVPIGGIGSSQVFAESINILNNPGFETGDLTSWTITDSTKFSVANDVYNSGNYSLKVTGPRIWKSCIQIVNIQSNTDYIFSFYKKGTGNVLCRVLTTANAVLVDASTSNTDSEWKRYTASFNSASNSQVKIYMSDATDTVYFDDFELRKSTAPSAVNVTVSGQVNVGQELSGNYDFIDDDGDSEGISLYRWLESDAVDGLYTPITGATQRTFTLTSAQAGKYIKFEVTPVDSTAKAGTAAQSDPVNVAEIVGTVLNNTGFETGDLTSWTITDSTKFSVANDVYNSGNYSLKVTGPRVWKSCIQTVNIQPDTDYLFSFYKKGTGDVLCKVLTMANEALVDASASNIDSEWKKYTAGFSSTDNTQVKIYISDATDTVYFDDFELRKSTTPGAINVTVSGQTNAGQELSGNYDFFDDDGDSEGISLYRWLESDTVDGLYSPITGAAQSKFILTSAQAGKYIKFEVTPVDSTGKAGTAVLSDPVNIAELDGTNIKNPGFETGDLTSWTITDPTKFSVANDVYHSGNYSLKVTGPQIWKSCIQIVNIQSDTDYLYSFYKKGMGKVIYKVVGLTAGVIIDASTSSSDSEWKKYTANFNSAGNTQLKIYLSDATDTAYFDDFELRKSTAPIAVNVTISGQAKVGQVLSGNYDFIDDDGDFEGISLYRWLESDTVDGQYTPIAGEIQKTFVVTSAQEGKYIRFEVTPMDSTAKIGLVVQSNPTQQIAEAGKSGILAVSIEKAVSLRDSAQIGNQPNQYPQSAVDQLNSVIIVSQGVMNNPDSTDAEIDGQITALNNALVVFEQSRITMPSNINNYITRSDDKLMDGSNEFRFISFNVPTILFDTDAGGIMPGSWEQEDAVKSVAQMGGQVIRTYTLSVRKAGSGPDVVRHVMAPGVFNEDAFKSMDKMLQLCNQYGIRVIIPFVDQWDYTAGGIGDYAAFRGKTKNEFYSDPQVISDYKQTINYVLNRVNTYTGVRYKDDKAVLAWETGNELSPTDAWTAEIAAYIKSIDRNHLVYDGNYTPISTASLENPDVDIVSRHYYSGDYVLNCKGDRAVSAGKKPFVIGEFGFIPTLQIQNLLDTGIYNGTSGIMIWSLRPHNPSGGFYNHDELTKDGILYKSYHWPGSPYGDSFDETNVVRLMRQKAFEIRGMQEPPIEAPDTPPVLFDTGTISNINWRGSTAASSYIVERAENAGGPWEIAGEDLYDYVPQGTPLFSDMKAVTGKSYYYRARAKNTGGESGYSNVIGPVEAHYILEDSTANNAKKYYYNNQFIVYKTPKPILSFRVYTKNLNGNTGDFKFFISADDVGYTEVVPDKVSGGQYEMTSGIIPGSVYLKIQYPGGSNTYGTVTGVSIEYVGDGSPIVPVKPLIESGILVDDMNDFSNMYSYSSNLTFDQADAEYAGNDGSRLSRKADLNEFITYKTLGKINSIKVETYYNNTQDVNNTAFKFYSSSDGVNFAAFDPNIRILGGVWEKVNYEAQTVPAGTNVIKIEFPVSAGEDYRFPQISRVQAGVGSGSVVFPGEPPANIIEDGEYYGGEDLLLQAAYSKYADSGDVRLKLDPDNKKTGTYGIRLDYNLDTSQSAGVTKILGDADGSGYDALQFWVKPDGYNRVLKVILETKDAKIWEAGIAVTGVDPKIINIPVDDFKTGSSASGFKAIDISAVRSFSLIVQKGEGPAGNGTLYFDDIRFVNKKVIDDFETYSDDTKLRQTYNQIKGQLAVSLESEYKNDGAYGLKYSYTLNTQNYAGMIRQLPSVDWSRDDRLKIWVKPDGSNHKLTFQIKTGNGDYWEAYYILSDTEPRLLEIPLKDFVYPSWYSGAGIMDLSVVDQFAIYINQNSSVQSGTLYFDTIEVAGTAATPTANPAAGTYKGTQSVVLSTATPGASIYYTTDGITTPTASSTLYTGAILVKSSTTIKAIAVKSGMYNSEAATFAYTINSGGKGSGSGSAIAPVPVAQVDGSAVIELDKPATNGDGTATFEVKDDILTEAFDLARNDSEGIKNVGIVISKVDGVKVYEQVLPARFLTEITKTKNIEIKTDIANVILPGNMLSAADVGSAVNVTISVAAADRSNLPAAIQTAIGNRPVVDLSVKVNGKVIQWNNEDAAVAVSIPYTPTADELKDPEKIVVWYTDSEGKAIPVTSGKYDAVTGMVSFNITHFSCYTVAYVNKTFNDLTGYEWAKKQIEVLASKGIIDGMSGTGYVPADNIRRADFLKLLVNTLGLTAKFDTNFDDVKSTNYYYNAVGIAKKLGITEGVGNNLFDPGSYITRQEMFTLTARALKVKKLLLTSGNAADLTKFTDSNVVASYAVESIAALVKDGLVEGDGVRLDPVANASRAEAAVLMYRIYNK